LLGQKSRHDSRDFSSLRNIAKTRPEGLPCVAIWQHKSWKTLFRPENEKFHFRIGSHVDEKRRRHGHGGGVCVRAGGSGSRDDVGRLVGQQR
jgi:hypothetical protein